MMSRRSRIRGRADGFTLLEVVIAMGILATGLLAVAAAQITALHVSSRSKHLLDAVHLAEGQLEAFRAMPVASLPATGNDPNNPISIASSDAADETVFNRSWTITPNNPTPGVTRITVAVNWFDSKLGATRTTTLQSLKGPF